MHRFPSTASVTIPAEWAGEEVHFVWDSTGEALLFKDGQPHQGALRALEISLKFVDLISRFERLLTLVAYY